LQFGLSTRAIVGIVIGAAIVLGVLGFRVVTSLAFRMQAICYGRGNCEGSESAMAIKNNGSVVHVTNKTILGVWNF
jgi:hypothetical protein